MALTELKPGDVATIGAAEWTQEEIEGKGLCVVRRRVAVMDEAMPLSEVAQRIAQLENDILVRQGHIDQLKAFAAKSVQISALPGDAKVIEELPVKEVEPIK